jgi:ATP-dependent Clp protease adaptor protein ClpS
MGNKEKIRIRPLKDTSSNASDEQTLILFNDEVNAFDFVVDSLIEVCGHDAVQAEQCTYIAHYKGKCDIKKGRFSTLRSMRHGLLEKGLQSIII